MAKKSGVSVRTVQYYDSRNILKPSDFSEGGRRLYTDDDLRTLKIICTLIHDELADAFPFVDKKKIRALKDVFWDAKISPINHIIGTKKNIETSEFETICLYFKTDTELNDESCKQALIDFSKACGTYAPVAVFPEAKNGCKLYLIALDYSKSNFKLKYYFKFEPSYDYSKLLKVFDGNQNQTVVRQIVGGQGYLEGFQFAVNTDSSLTYNFYFKENNLQ